MRKLAYAALLSVLLCCTAAAQKYSSGKGPVSAHVDASASIIKLVLTSHFTSRGYQIDSESDSQIAFSHEIDGSGLATQLQLGNEHFDEPRHVIYFTLAANGPQTVLTGRHEIVVRMALGNVTRISLDVGKNRDPMVEAIDDIRRASEVREAVTRALEDSKQR